MARKNAKTCKEKNIKPGGYVVLTIVLWIVLELAGGLIGALLFPYERIMLYLFALIGAGLGAFISYTIVKNLDPGQPEGGNLLDSGLSQEGL